MIDKQHELTARDFTALQDKKKQGHPAVSLRAEIKVWDLQKHIEGDRSWKKYCSVIQTKLNCLPVEEPN